MGFGARFFAIACLMLGADVAAAEPWRLQTAVGAPDWLTLSGNARARYETLDGQFRAGGQGGDQVLVWRGLLLARADFDRIAFAAELQDSRAYFDDDGTPLSASFVNVAEPLQMFTELSLDGVFGAQSDAALQLGRFTLDIGSRRFVERNGFRNTINAYDGAHFRWAGANGAKANVFYVSPLRKEPASRAARGDNEAAIDETQGYRRFWGAYYAFAPFANGVHTELFAYGLNEKDRANRPTPNRDYVSPGARVYKKPGVGAFDFEIEGAWRTGERRATSDPADVTDLDVNAFMLHAEAGYTFDHPWNVRLLLEYDLATGDDDPNDDKFDQYERLFGTRRADLGNTSINGALTRQNASVGGGRVEFKKGRVDGRLIYNAAFLHSNRDAWAVARVRDPAGQSGNFIGHLIDGRARYWLKPGNVRLEAGASYFVNGRFADKAPNASGEGDTAYGYVQAVLTF